MQYVPRCFVIGLYLLVSLCCVTARAADEKSPPASSPTRPNILWISLEDISPDLGCYGDGYADTPVIDKLASESVRYTRCFSHAGVCAPARSGIITGMYPPSITTQHMRCQGVPPPEARCFTEYLRAAGYFCTNNSKTDYQFAAPITAWDENGGKAHWKNRGKDASGNTQPFFAVFNLTTTHESQVRTGGAIGRKLPPDKKHDPAKAVLPPYYPDTPIVRQDWANYYDNFTATETKIAQLLKELDDAGLREETIVWFWGDHGRGLSRGKRWLYDSGTQVPLLIRVPEKYRRHAAPRDEIVVAPGKVDEELHAFIDFAPTMLSLCGLSIPKQMQGQAFLGPKTAEKPREYVYGHRDRMDERYDLIRMVRDKKYLYLRNFRPDLTYAQHINYMDQMPMMKEWRRLAADGELNDVQKIFFSPYKPVEELYDTESDPHNVVNLAGQPEHLEQLKKMRAECFDWMLRINDTGLIAEAVIEDVNHPAGKKPETPRPNLAVRERDGQYAVSFSVPHGGSVAYQIQKELPSLQVDRPAKKKADSDVWQVAVDETPVMVAKGYTIICKGVRLGYRDSKPLVCQAGLATPAADQDNEKIGYEVLRKINQACFPRSYLERQIAILGIDSKMTDQEKITALEKLYDIMAKENLTPLEKRALKERAEHDFHYAQEALGMKRVSQLSPAEEVQEQIVILEDSQNEFERLHAAHDLDRLGEAARPALKIIQAATKRSGYDGRVCAFLVEKLTKE